MTAKSITPDDLRAALPNTSSALILKGLESNLQVYRDTYGIPHVRAQSLHDAFFGQGFVAAQDRLWHMDYDRHRAYGRWAEFAGHTAIAQDRQMRRFQIASSISEDYLHLDDETRAMLDAYAAGVNAFIETTDSLPVEYGLVDSTPEQWQPWDCLAVFKVRHILMGVFESKLWRARLVNALGPERAAEILRGYQPGHLLIVPPGTEYEGPILDALKDLSKGVETVAWLEDAEAGSNNWALAGSRTASGKPLVAGDPHRALDTPSVYYQNHLTCPEFDVVGLSFPGFPGFPHFGHNSNVAWCVTHAMADYQDPYVERFNKDDPTQYDWKGRWSRAQVRREIIEVRDGPTEEIKVTLTHHGPIVVGDPADGYGIAFKYTATAPAKPNHGFESVLPMLRSTTADELEESMREWVDPCNNFVYADVHGEIGYLYRGKVPVRSSANGWLPVPGWTGEHEWRGHIPFEEMPRVRNPDTGYIVTANNRVVGHDYPHYLGLDYAPEFRARRILERIKVLDSATVQDMASVHAERLSMPAQTYKALLDGLVPLDEFSAKAGERLAGWDGTMGKELVAPTVYSAFRLRFHQAAARHLLGPFADEVFSATGRGGMVFLIQFSNLVLTLVVDQDTSLLPSGTDWPSLAARALADGVSDLRQRLGDDMESWQWGSVHHTRPRHTLSDALPELAGLLDPPSVPMGGDGDTPQAASYSPLDPFIMTGMSVARYVFDLGDWNNSAWVTPLGASGHPGSPHYSDQAPIWGEVQLIPMLYDWDRIIAQAESRQTLSPNQGDG